MSRVIDRLKTSRESVQFENGEKKGRGGPRLWLWMMGIAALALPQHLFIPLQSVVQQALQYILGRSRFFPGWVQVFHTQQPKSLIVTGVEITRQCSDQ